VRPAETDTESETYALCYQKLENEVFNNSKLSNKDLLLKMLDAREIVPYIKQKIRHNGANVDLIVKTDVSEVVRERNGNLVELGT
jgi:hypothetical protein